MNLARTSWSPALTLISAPLLALSSDVRCSGLGMKQFNLCDSVETVRVSSSHSTLLYASVCARVDAGLVLGMSHRWVGSANE